MSKSNVKETFLALRARHVKFQATMEHQAAADRIVAIMARIKVCPFNYLQYFVENYEHDKQVSNPSLNF